MLEQKLSCEMPKKRSLLRNAVLGLAIGLIGLVGGCDSGFASKKEERILCSYSTIIKESPRPICAFRLFTINQSGDDMQQIQIPNLEDYLQLTDSVPFWNGRTVLFSTEMDLCSINYDGTDMKKLTSFCEQFNNRTDKTEGPKFIDAFSISPDDKQIVFTRGNDLYVMNSDGSNARILKESSDRTRGISWAPNGKQIALADDYLSVMNLNTYEIKRLIPDKNPARISGRCWSSDSKRIVFLSYNFDKQALNVINADGTVRRQLAEFSTCQESPTWSADNRKILFVSFKGMASELYTIDVETKDINKITFTGGTIKNSYFIP